MNTDSDPCLSVSKILAVVMILPRRHRDTEISQTAPCLRVSVVRVKLQSRPTRPGGGGGLARCACIPRPTRQPCPARPFRSGGAGRQGALPPARTHILD